MREQRERRAYQRLTEKHKVRLVVVSAPDEPSLRNKEYSGWTQDIGMGGLQLFARRSLPVGTVLDVRIELSRPHEVFERSGRVIWSQQPTGKGRVIIGVSFTDKSRETVIVWRRMLARRC